MFHREGVHASLAKRGAAVTATGPSLLCRSLETRGRGYRTLRQALAPCALKIDRQATWCRLAGRHPFDCIAFGIISRGSESSGLPSSWPNSVIGAGKPAALIWSLVHKRHLSLPRRLPKVTSAPSAGCSICHRGDWAAGTSGDCDLPTRPSRHGSKPEQLHIQGRNSPFDGRMGAGPG